MVHETDSIVPGNSKSFCTSVDLPEPDGPETINTSGAARSFDVLHLFAQFFDFGFHLEREPVISRPSRVVTGSF